MATTVDNFFDQHLKPLMVANSGLTADYNRGMLNAAQQCENCFKCATCASLVIIGEAIQEQEQKILELERMLKNPEAHGLVRPRRDPPGQTYQAPVEEVKESVKEEPVEELEEKTFDLILYQHDTAVTSYGLRRSDVEIDGTVFKFDITGPNAVLSVADMSFNFMGLGHHSFTMDGEQFGLFIDEHKDRKAIQASLDTDMAEPPTRSTRLNMLVVHDGDCELFDNITPQDAPFEMLGEAFKGWLHGEHLLITPEDIDNEDGQQFKVKDCFGWNVLSVKADDGTACNVNLLVWPVHSSKRGRSEDSEPPSKRQRR